MVNGCAREWALLRCLNNVPGLAGVDLVLAKIISFLQIAGVRPSHVRAVGSSSCMDDSASSVGNTLRDDDSAWWVSSPNSCPGGQGAEWCAYDIGDPAKPGVLVRVEQVHLKIPPLPQGPLSVRVFHLEASDGGSVGGRDGGRDKGSGGLVAAARPSWRRVTPDLTTLDTGEMQRWGLSPAVEARLVRIVCTMTAEADLALALEARDEAEREEREEREERAGG